MPLRQYTNGSNTLYMPNIDVLFGQGASKSTTQGGIFDLKLYITFDCADSMGF
jgi:hypothetical protein